MTLRKRKRPKMMPPKDTAPICDRGYLDSLHDEACIVCGEHGDANETIDPAHIGGFKGMKRGDDEALPLKHRFHQLGHQKGEMTMWRENLPDYILREALRAYARECYRKWKEEQK